MNLSYIPKIHRDEQDSGDGWLLTAVKGTIPDANSRLLAGEQGMLTHLVPGSQIFLSACGWPKVHLELPCVQTTGTLPQQLPLPRLLTQTHRLPSQDTPKQGRGWRVCSSKHRPLRGAALGSGTECLSTDHCAQREGGQEGS